MISQEEAPKLAHLLRRTGFGARPSEWTTYADLGVSGTTDRLLHPEAVPDHLDQLMQEIGPDYIDFTQMNSVSRWWLFRMLHTPRPLEEKMTLFWHNHFATANYKVQNPAWMWQQNQIFRTYALGNFRDILRAVSRDPAMLTWLDGEENRVGYANENYGRELQELFTMGFGSGYTENDVKSAAKAFTGWRIDHQNSTFFFDPKLHDETLKTYLGETGNLNGDDIINIIVRQPATAHYMSRKLFVFFVHDNPSDSELQPLIDAYFQSGYDMRAVVAAILNGPSFYSRQAMYANFKNPADYTVTLMRTMNASLESVYDPASQISEMGQELFNPPNVKGWPGGKTWINTMTLLTRVNLANEMINSMMRQGTFYSNAQALLAVSGASQTDGMPPEQLVDSVWNALVPGMPPSPSARQALIAYVQDPKDPNHANFNAKAPGLFSLVLTAPEYHLA